MDVAVAAAAVELHVLGVVPDTEAIRHNIDNTVPFSPSNTFEVTLTLQEVGSYFVFNILIQEKNVVEVLAFLFQVVYSLYTEVYEYFLFFLIISLKKLIIALFLP